MPANPVRYVGDKLVVGPLDFSYIPATPCVPGTTVLNGPCWIGAGLPSIPTANCMIGPGLNPISLQVIGLANIVAINNQIGIFNRSGLGNVFGFTSKLAADMKIAFAGTTALSAKAAVQTTAGAKLASSKLTTPLLKAAVLVGDMTATVGMNPTFTAAWAPLKPVGSKNFDINHPLKKGWRLRYVCTEGSTADVYVKGTLKDSNTITLPDYWDGLVDSKSIHVILTSIGNHQKLFYNISECGTKIIVSNDSDNKIHCYYKVFAERKDTPRNIVEYEGSTINDYPGDNEEYRFWFTSKEFL